jgi:uncharacterized protein
VIAYLDSSVILNVLLGQKPPHPRWTEVETGVSSGLTRVECLRVLDRVRVQHAASENDLAEMHARLFALLKKLEIVTVSEQVLDRAAQPFPVTIATLDSIHLASALLWRQSEEKPLVFLTHDRQLARAAESAGMEAGF